jgi:hypothetical protein
MSPAGTVDAESVTGPPAPEEGNSTFLNFVIISRFVFESKKALVSGAYFALTV